MTRPQPEPRDRWLGVFRSVALEPVGAARYAHAQRERRRAGQVLLCGGGIVLLPGLATALFAFVEAARGEGLMMFIVFGWLLCPIVGASVFFHGWARWRLLRHIQPTSEVEVFAGCADDGRPAGDPVTDRLLKHGVVHPRQAHRLVAHARTGVVLEVDGVVPGRFSGGDVTVTAAMRPETQNDTTERHLLTGLETVELQMMRKRLIRPPWGKAYGTSFVAGGVVHRSVERLTDTDSSTNTLITWSVILGGGALLVLLDRPRTRRLLAAINRDMNEGLRQTKDGWTLVGSELVWQRHGVPAPERLLRGGLGQGN